MKEEKYYLSNKIPLNIGKNITAIRKHFELSQRDFAIKLGISKATISLWESGKKYPSRKNVENLASIFNIDPEDLFSSDVNEKLAQQVQFKFKPAFFSIRPGIELKVETEKLSKEELDLVQKSIKLLKVFYSK